jgi:hypothetical protein
MRVYVDATLAAVVAKLKEALDSFCVQNRELIGEDGKAAKVRLNFCREEQKVWKPSLTDSSFLLFLPLSTTTSSPSPPSTGDAALSAERLRFSPLPPKGSWFTFGRPRQVFLMRACELYFPLRVLC